MEIFDSIFTDNSNAFTPAQFFLCFLCAIFIGLFVCIFCTYRNNFSRSYLTTLALLPPVISVIVVIVNDNIGMGIAIAGAFSLMKFRSIPGKPREMLYLAATLAAGLLNGTGYLGYAILFTVTVGVVSVVYIRLDIGKDEETVERLRISVPENLDYCHAFDAPLNEYTERYALVKSKTANMGSIFVVYFDVVFKKDAARQNFLEAILRINGRLDVTIKEIDDSENGLD